MTPSSLWFSKIEFISKSWDILTDLYIWPHAHNNPDAYFSENNRKLMNHIHFHLLLIILLWNFIQGFMVQITQQTHVLYLIILLKSH